MIYRDAITAEKRDEGHPRGKVYIAAYSHEVERARLWMTKMRQAGYAITCDWTPEVERFRALGRPPNAAERTEAAEIDKAGVLNADIIWILAPAEGGAGVHTELGIALGWNAAVEAFGNDCEPTIRIIVSGAHARNVFCAIAHHYFDTDQEAFEHLTNW